MHLSGFRGILSILEVDFVVRISSSVQHVRIQLAEPMCFFTCFETCCFSLLYRFWWFLNMLRMVRKLLGQSRRLFAVFSGFWSFRAVDITSFRYYWDSCCFLMHLSGFRCILLISVIHFVVCGFRCLLDVRSYLGPAMRLFSVIFRMLFFTP